MRWSDWPRKTDFRRERRSALDQIADQMKYPEKRTTAQLAMPKPTHMRTFALCDHGATALCGARCTKKVLNQPKAGL